MHHFHVFLMLLLLAQPLCNSNEIFPKYEKMIDNDDTELLVINIIHKIMYEVNCFIIIVDEYHHHIIGNIVNSPLEIPPYFQILVDEMEDLLSPNYDTMKVIQEVKKNNCNLYIIFLNDGDQIARLLTFGDRHRIIDSRAKFIVKKDRRMFSPKNNILWKKIINVLFIRKYNGSKRFELSTVPFPPPIIGLIVPYRINTWNHTFHSNKNLFEDKTSNLKGQSLKVVTFDHKPTAIVIYPLNHTYNQDTENTIFTGLEIEVLKTLSTAMNFNYLVYESPNANEELWGRLQTNGSYSGLLGEMRSGKADIALGNLYYTPYHLEMLDLSIPYNTECLTFLTPESFTDNSWHTLILPFQETMWIAVIIVLLVAGFVFYFFAIYHNIIKNRDFSSNRSSTIIKSEMNSGENEIDKLYNKTDHVLNRLRGYFVEKLKKINRRQIFFKKHNKQIVTHKKRHLWYTNFQRRLTQFISSKKDEDITITPKGLYIFEKLNNSILYTCGMFLNVSLPRVPAVWTIRMFIGWWWIYCILVSVAYKASLTAILANPAPRVTIDSLDQLAESSLECGGWGEQSKEFFVTSLDVASQKIGRKFEITYDVDSAVERVAAGEFAYYENIYYLHYLTVKHKDVNIIQQYNETEDKNIDKTKGKILHIMQNCVIHMPISVGLQKNSPLKPRIDTFLARVIQAGLVKKWLNDAMFRILTTKAEQDKNEPKTLMTLNKLHGAIAVLIAGYIISIITVIMELILWHCYEKRQPSFDPYNLKLYYANKAMRKNIF